MRNASGHMHALQPTPPASPKLSPRKLRNGRTKSVRIQGLHFLPQRSIMHYFACLILSFFLKRHGLFLLAPVIYISGMLLYMGTISLEIPRIPKYSPPGSLYRSSQVFDTLWPEMQGDTRIFPGVKEAWDHPRPEERWKPCLHHNSDLAVSRSNGYIVIEANGGLNQQRSTICNAVAVARLLNATLVIPRFHLNSVWKDRSVFGDIYDEEHFITSLARDLTIVRDLPPELMDQQGNMTNIYNVRVKAWARPEFYQETVLPKLIETRVLRFAPFANRLSFDGIPHDIQQLRCRANFEALRFAEPISDVGQMLVKRMVEKSRLSNGRYIAVHLRFEKDMVAFSCCIYDGGDLEKKEMDEAREVGWRGKFTRPGRVIKPAALRRDGKCPLTPVEVGMMLRGMGFKDDTPIYLASGKIYKAEKFVEPLRQMFPALQTKETLLSSAELAPFKNFSSRMAALDYTVCLHSEVFVTTQGGNFPQILIGHRRFLNKGHSKTIRPDKRKLALLLDNPSIGWDAFSGHMMSMRRHSDVKGHELRKPNASIYTYPAPECMCPDRLVRSSPEFSALE